MAVAIAAGCVVYLQSTRGEVLDPRSNPSAGSELDDRRPRAADQDSEAAIAARDRHPMTPSRSVDGRKPASLDALFKAHLEPAPDYLQEAASKAFTQQATLISGQMAGRSQDRMSDVMSVVQDGYAVRLRRLAAQATADGRGLLLVGGCDFREAIAGKTHVRWSGGESLFGKGLEVLVVLEEEDAELVEFDRRIRELRAIDLAERLQHFNNLPVEQRSAAIKEYRRCLADGTADDQGREWFGIDARELRWIRVDPGTLQIVPTGR
ncbi:MAG: hypothetical protein ACE37K_22085 [Planctomycetota bacterium]